MSFTARFRSECAQCDEPIVPGQEAEYDWGHNVQHVICPEAKTLAGVPRQVCPKCFMEMPVTGVCGTCEY